MAPSRPSSALTRDEPLALGVPIPDVEIPPPAGDMPPIPLSTLKGQSWLMAFAPPGWNPAARQAVAMLNRIINEWRGSLADGEGPRPSPGEASSLGEAKPWTAISLVREGIWCHLTLSDGAVAFPLVSDGMDGDVARAFGVQGRRALFVVDGAGLVRWRHVLAPGDVPTVATVEEAWATLRLMCGHGFGAATSGSWADGVDTPEDGYSELACLSRRQFIVMAVAIASLAADLTDVSATAPRGYVPTPRAEPRVPPRPEVPSPF